MERLFDTGIKDALIQEHCSVESVALHRFETSVADDAAKLLFGGAVAGARGSNDIFFEHYGADVIAAKVKSQFQHLQALRDPARLHVLNVVKIKPRDSEHLQVFNRRGIFPAAAAKRRMTRLKAPGDEGCEAARFFLQPSNHVKVIDALFKRLADAEHHGRGGPHA